MHRRDMVTNDTSRRMILVGINCISGRKRFLYCRVQGLNRQFLHVCLEISKKIADDDVICDVIGPCEVNHVLPGQRGTITVVLVLDNDNLVWSENFLNRRTCRD